ncbi:MAG: ankyrin repeat domain-containing protein [Proteobacteria bacterium]|nr:ankyrin repeat domain-containing protein [Pseudomonadota bacterium]MBU1710169.1 ankyrin repeat domain-containing protein [Pseudomonadota bacterium]
MENSEKEPTVLFKFRQAMDAGDAAEVMKMLHNEIAVDVDFGGGVRPLHLAVQQGPDEIVQILIAQGADPDAVTESGWTALHTAALMGNLETAQVLIDHGATLNIANDLGHRPIDLARAHKRQSMISLLDKAGKKPWQFWKK